MATTTSSVLQLCRAGAHLLRCRPNKSSLGKWKEHPATEEACRKHMARNGLIGVIPSSLGAVVVDVDKGAENVRERLEAVAGEIGLPVFLHTSSKEGHYHLWYRLSDDVEECTNSGWKIHGAEGGLLASGEIRGTNGYVVLWNSDKVAEHLEDLGKAEPVDLTPLIGTPPAPTVKKHHGAVDLGDLKSYSEVTYDTVENLLDQIDPDVDYQTWLLIGAAIQSRFPYDDGLYLWDNWSAQGKKYDEFGPNHPREKWGTFDEDGGVTIGTLFHYASLSETTPEIPPAAQIASVIHGAPALPDGYKRVKVGERTVIKKTVELEGGKKVDLTVSDWDIYPVSYGVDESLGYETVRFKWDRPHVGWSDLVLRTAYLNHGSRDFPTAITDQTGVTWDKERIGAFQTMMSDYLKKLQDVRTITPLFNTMGWKDDNRTFVLGKTLMRRRDDGRISEETTAFTNTIRKEKLGAFSTAGQLDSWKELTRAIEQGDMPLHGFAIGVGLSAPLYHFAGLKGLVISLYGETGGGKSLAQYWAQSIWGDPEALHIKANHTQNALYKRMGMHCHLPVTIDEVTMMLDKEVGDFCFNVSQGRDRMRLNKNSEEQETHTWATPVLVSTNKSLQSKLTASGLETDAQLARLFELNVSPHPLFQESSDLGGFIYQQLTSHYGHAGHVFMRNLLNIKEEDLRSMIEKNRHGLASKYGVRFKGEERYWEQMLNLADFALTCADRWGLILFDYQKCIQRVLWQVKDNREFSKDMRLTGFDMVGEYLTEFNNLAVSVFHTERNGHIQMDQNRVPRDTVRIRFDLYRPKFREPFHKGILSIDRSHFKNWLASKGWDYTALKKELRSAGALIGPATDRGTLGKHTQFRLRQTTIFRFDLTHPDFQNILEDMESGNVDIKEDD